MSLEPAISVRDISKTYRIYGNPYGRLKELLPWNKHPHHQRVEALKPLSFEVMPGQCVGLVGGNGAGKSTLLKILTGTTFPDTGSYKIRGRVASLLELGAGFTMDFSGKENIYMNGAMMGLTRKEMKSRYHSILEFSGLEEFIDAPLRTYSSGMVCRLGFSVAVAIDPDVLIIDEILSVGDMQFQKKCAERIYSYREQGKTMFFCSHSLYDVRQICDEAMWLDQGQLRLMGDVVEVTNEYATNANKSREDGRDLAPDLQETELNRDLPHLVSVDLFDPQNGQARHIFNPGDEVGVRLQFRNGRDLDRISLGVAVTQRDRSILFACSTEMDGIELPLVEGGVAELILPNLRLLAGEYVLMCGVLDRNGFHRYHQMPSSQNLVVQNKTTKDLGVMLHRHEWRLDALIPAPGAEGEELSGRSR